jgi:hypothetical protein
METRTERLTDDKENCAELATIIHEGHEFTAQGASMWTDETGKIQGILYTGNTGRFSGPGNVPPIGFNYLQTWDGSLKIPCTLGSTWENSFVDYHGRRQVNQSFYFTIKGRKCRGVNYNREWSQIVRFKEI